jgi:hypothetical protein
LPWKVERAVNPDPALHDVSPTQNATSMSLAVVVVNAPLLTALPEPALCELASSGDVGSAPLYSAM